MRHHLVMTPETSLGEFRLRLLRLNSYLPFFPKEKEGVAPTALPEWELRNILDRAKPLDWHMSMLSANIDMYSLSWPETVCYLERLEVLAALKKKAGVEILKKHDTSDTTVNSTKKNAYKREGSPTVGEKPKCSTCGKIGHTADKCWHKDKGKRVSTPGSQEEGARKKRRFNSNEEKSYNKELVNAMIAALPMFQKAIKKPKKKARKGSDSDGEHTLPANWDEAE